MISFFTDSLLPLTLLLLALILLRKPIMKSFGTKLSYQLWLLVPFFLLTHNMPSFSFNTYTLPSSALTVVFSDLPMQTEALSNTPWLIYAWATGALMVFAYFIFAHHNFRNNLKEELDPNFNQRSERRTHTFPSVHRSNNITSPLLIGLLKQKLIVPTRFEQSYSQKQQELIIAHEICHYRRGDIYWNLLATTCLLLFWFHPLAWLAYTKFKQDQELSCDHQVLVSQSLNDKKQYALALLNTIGNKQSAGLLHLSFGKSGDKNIMLERIQQVQVNKKHNKLAAISLFSFAIFLLSSTTNAGTDTVRKASKPSQSVQPEKASLPEKPTLAEKATLPKQEESPIEHVLPRYPVDAARNGIEGSVSFVFDINEKGVPQNIKVVESNPNGIFDEQATIAFKQWRYSESESYRKGQVVQIDFRMN